MRFESLPEEVNDGYEYIQKNNWVTFSLESAQSWDDLLRDIDSNLKEYGLEIVILETDNEIDETYYKIKPRTLLDATKYMVEKGVPIG